MTYHSKQIRGNLNTQNFKIIKPEEETQGAGKFEVHLQTYIRASCKYVSDFTVLQYLHFFPCLAGFLD